MESTPKKLSRGVLQNNTLSWGCELNPKTLKFRGVIKNLLNQNPIKITNVQFL